MATTVVLFCRCAHRDLVDATVLDEIDGWLLGSDLPCLLVDDLCGLAARRDPLLARIAACDSVAVIACHPRGVRALFRLAGAPLHDTGVLLLNPRSESAEEIIEALSTLPAGEPPAGEGPEPAAGDWEPWFPVIDRERCTNCGQCQNFCIFGVYGRDADGQVAVAAPRNCKTDCPACARVCPNLAIIFPKHAQRPIDGSEPRPDEHGVDIRSVAAGDICSLLRQRSSGPRPRFAQDLADGEVCPCELDPEALLDRLGVPREVIEANRDEMRRRLGPETGAKG